MTPAPITGGCLCGAVRYRCSRPPRNMGICQCERCQRQSGSAFLMATVFDREAVRVERGELRTYSAAAAPGAGLHRHFCPSCGSALMITLDRHPDLVSVMGGSLDDKTLLKPTYSLWSASGQAWLELPAHIRRHAAAPGHASD